MSTIIQRKPGETDAEFKRRHGIYTPDRITMRAQGKTYREIGQAMGVSRNAAFLWFRRHAPEYQRVESIGKLASAAELRTWLDQRKELHVHLIGTKSQRQWVLVGRASARCGTRRCLRLPCQ